MPVENRKPRLADTRRSAIHCADVDLEYYRLRSFSITSHGICNLGDSMRKRRSRSITSVTSTSGAGEQRTVCERGRNNSNASQASNQLVDGELFDEVADAAAGKQTAAAAADDDDNENDGRVAYKVAMLGDGGVGKTALTYQFTTSDYICAYDLSLDDDYGQKTVSVLLDGQETDLEIIDHPACEMSTESFCSTYNIDHFVVVYSVVDRRTFKVAEQILHYLRDSEMLLTRGAILVGNKTDLERHREVTRQAGRHLAKEVACKFIETSSGLDHNVNELLVGIVAQVKLNPQRIRNLSDKQKMQLAAVASTTGSLGGPALLAATSASKTAAPSASAAAAALVQQKQRKQLAAGQQQQRPAAAAASVDPDSISMASSAAAAVVVVPLPRTVRENQLFTAGGRPFGQRVVLSIKQAAHIKQRTSSSTSAASGSASDANADETTTLGADVFDADDAQGARDAMAASRTSSSGGSPSHGPAQAGGAKPPPVVATSSSPVSRISMRTKYLLTSLMKFKRTLRVKRRNSSSCSDLFVI